MRHLRYLNIILALIVCTATIGLAQMRPGSQMPTKIRGQVRLPNGAPVENVTVELEMNGGGGTITTRTDPMGKFAFEGLAASAFYIRIKHPQYQEVYTRADVSITPMAFVDISLKPIDGAVVAETAPTIPIEAQQQLEKGRKKAQEGKGEAAIKDFEKAIKIYPNYADAYFELGTTYMGMGKFPEAQAALEKVLAIDPNYGVAYLALGAAYNRMNNLPAAEQSLLKVIQISPDAMEAHYELARTYLAMNRNDVAEKHARRAVELKSDYAPARVALGNALLRNRNTAAAVTEFKEYLRLEPQGPMSAGVKDLLARLEKPAGQ